MDLAAAAEKSQAENDTGTYAATVRKVMVR